MTPDFREEAEKVNSSIRDRFLAKVIKTESCWEWVGCVLRGYGRFGVGYKVDKSRRSALAHRVAYELFKGPIPDGLVLDHLCRNTVCVNPDHLEAVTQRINTIRGVSPRGQNGRKTHCKRGHEFTAENTYTQPGRTNRVCRTCEQLRKAGLLSKHAGKGGSV